MIVAIAEASATAVPVLEFRQAATTADAVTDYVNDYTPPRDPADYVGVDSGWSPRAPELQSWWAVDGGVLVERLTDIQDDLVLQIKEHRDFKRLAEDVRFEYPAASGNLFSASLLSENNWGNFSAAVQLPIPSQEYPQTVTTYDERQSIDIVDSAMLTAMVDALSLVVLTERSTAASAISAVLAATTAADAHAAAAGYLDS